MKIALIGYGKMGKAIEEIALQRGHEIVLKITSANASALNVDVLREINPDVAIEFTGPTSAYHNVRLCLAAAVPVISGSTGWLANLPDAERYCIENDGCFLYASNFSIGVNLFFKLNSFLATLMSAHNNYRPSVTEIHHTQKKDAPSGTAITLAEEIIAKTPMLNKWVSGPTDQTNELAIASERIDPAPGTHIVKYSSEIDEIVITHEAKSRKGFAAGALLAAEFVAEKKGVYTMQDVLNL